MRGRARAAVRTPARVPDSARAGTLRQLRKLAWIELRRRAHRLEGLRFGSTGNERRLEGQTRRRGGGAGAFCCRALHDAIELQLQVIDAEYRRMACGVSLRGHGRRKAISNGFVGAAVRDDAVASGDLAVLEVNDARPLTPGDLNQAE